MTKLLYRARRSLANWLYPDSIPNQLGEATIHKLKHTDAPVTSGVDGIHISMHKASSGFVVKCWDTESEYCTKGKQNGPTLHIINDTDDFTESLSRIILMQQLVR
ncbi:hypothetical protein UFOVP116_389 [uncultured Caudovirales phage]|uniref:Uncharacterized protein n=1 Tax=uncultured Caudovirales phage TaxID=2100421 RepID=A0A6J5LFD2_9CAUD|nr:hypothetical protein UFOVP116_389 [uncultured Caudovirales phage]